MSHQFKLVICVDSITEFKPPALISSSPDGKRESTSPSIRKKMEDFSILQPTYSVTWKNGREKLSETAYATPKSNKINFFASNKQYKIRLSKQQGLYKEKLIAFTVKEVFIQHAITV